MVRRDTNLDGSRDHELTHLVYDRSSDVVIVTILRVLTAVRSIVRDGNTCRRSILSFRCTAQLASFLSQ